MLNIKTINELIAKYITLMVGTMWCVYAFAILVIIPLFFPATQTIVMYISSSFLQLILLPLIMVGQDILNRKSEKRAEEDHETLLEELSEIKELHKDLHTLINTKTRKKL